jgi:hypothetical protein
MRGLPPIRSASRVRRWDAVILGSALPGLVAAIRLGMRGLRVLILEEDAAAARFPGLRGPVDGHGRSSVSARTSKLGIRRSIAVASARFPTGWRCRARVDVGDAGGRSMSSTRGSSRPGQPRASSSPRCDAAVGSGALVVRAAIPAPAAAAAVAMSAAPQRCARGRGQPRAGPARARVRRRGPSPRSAQNSCSTSRASRRRAVRSHLLGGALGDRRDRGQPALAARYFDSVARSTASFASCAAFRRLIRRAPPVQLERAPEICAGRALPSTRRCARAASATAR